MATTPWVQKIRDDIADLQRRVAKLEAPPVPPIPWTGTIQSHIDAAAVGSTVKVPPGTYNERVTVAKKLAALDLTGVTLDGKGLGVPQQHGVLSVLAGADGLRVLGGATTNSDGAGTDVSNVADVTLEGHEMHHNAEEGYHLNACQRITFRGGSTHHNNAQLTVSAGWEAGGGKASGTDAVALIDFESHHNGGPGVWFDGHCTHSKAIRVHSHHNSGMGIFDETSDGTEIDHCHAWENGWGYPNWAYGAGIGIAHGCNAYVHDSIAAWNADGIPVFSQTRPDAQPRKNNRILNNLIAVTRQPIDPGDIKALGFLGDFPDMFDPASGNKADKNLVYRGDDPGPASRYRYDWAGDCPTIADFNAKVGGTNREIGLAELIPLLSAAGVPTAPEPHV